jgi:hypothetical protein
MAYLLNNLKDVQAVYLPEIAFLIDDFLPYLDEFSLSKKVILESLRFKIKLVGNSKEEIYTSEFNLEHILTGIKFNLISKNPNDLICTVDFNHLISNIDLDVFKTELDKKLINEENKFCKTIDDSLGEINTILFERNLKKDVLSLLASISNLKSLLSSSNEFDKIVIDKYLSSYNKTYSHLEAEYKPCINNKEIFKSKIVFNGFVSSKLTEWEAIKGFNPNPTPIGEYSEFFKEHLTDQIGFGKFKKDKRFLASKTVSNSFESDSTIKNSHLDIFKSGEVYGNFIKYIQVYIVEPYVDYSYLFQRMLNEKLIHRIKHKDFVEWLKENRLIKNKDYVAFFEKGGFYSLKKSTSVHRENNFNLIFKM